MPPSERPSIDQFDLHDIIVSEMQQRGARLIEDCNDSGFRLEFATTGERIILLHHHGELTLYDEGPPGVFTLLVTSDGIDAMQEAGVRKLVGDLVNAATGKARLTWRL